jgi:RNA polymerase primary sigma factor
MAEREQSEIPGGDAAPVLEMLVDRGQVQGYLTRSDVVDYLPQAAEDENLLEQVLDSVTGAGVIFTEVEDEEDGFNPEEEDELSQEDLDLDPQDLEGVEVDDIIRIYMKEAAQTPLLTADQEIELAKRIERCRLAHEELRRNEVPPERREELQRQIRIGKAARERLVRSNTRLVISVARKYMGRGLPFLDLIQEGNIGLLRAIRNFDYRRGFKFSTYATWWIRQAVTRALAEQSRTIRLPVHMSDAVNRMLRAQGRLQQTLGRAATPDELASALSIPKEKVEQMLQIVRQPISLQTPIGEDEEDVLGDLIPDTSALGPEESTESALMSEDMYRRLESLPQREQQVLQLRYGLGADEPMTLEQVGRQMGITRERARQLELQALNRLRNLEEHETEEKTRRRKKT